MTSSEIDRILRRIKDTRRYSKKILNDEKSTEDQRDDAEVLQETLEELIDSMCRYTCNVFDDNYKNASRAQMKDKYTDLKDYQTKCEEIEKARKASHDNLIINIRMVDLLCREFGIEEIYGKLPEEYKKNTDGLMGERNRSNPRVVETRHAIADWTFDFVLGCTVGMYMDMGDYNKNVDDYKRVAEDFKYNQKGSYGAKKVIMDLTEPDF